MVRQEANSGPSSEWKPEERISLAASLAEQLRESAETGYVPGRTVYDIAERISLILTEDSGILEANRQSIIEGKSLSNH